MGADLWSIVLAAGAGRRLAGVTGGIPKQFWSADGGPTLLEQTLERTSPLAPPGRTVIVVDRSHAPFVKAIPALRRFGRVIHQACDRGTATGVLLALAHVAETAPDALVLLTPSDHGFVEPDAFVSGVRGAADAIRAGTADIILFGVAAGSAERDYGWIVPGDSRGDALRSVDAFVEKPELVTARRLLDAGGLWNTMVLVGRASALLGAYRSRLPALTDALLSVMARPNKGLHSVREQYGRLPVADFSRDLLGATPGLLVHTWPSTVGWSDLGVPARLEQWRHAARPPVERERAREFVHAC